jgi:hypothetical protein
MQDLKHIRAWQRAHTWNKYTTETVEVRKMTYGYRKKVLEGHDEAQ